MVFKLGLSTCGVILPPFHFFLEPFGDVPFNFNEVFHNIISQFQISINFFKLWGNCITTNRKVKPWIVPICEAVCFSGRNNQSSTWYRPSNTGSNTFNTTDPLPTYFLILYHASSVSVALILVLSKVPHGSSYSKKYTFILHQKASDE